MIQCLLIQLMQKAATLSMVGIKGVLMKNRMIFFTLMLLSTVTTFALTSEEKAAQEKENMKILEQMGLPLPGSGIKLVPRAMLGLTPEEIAQGDKEMAEFKEKGYVNKYINRPRELLSITQAMVKKEIKSSLKEGGNSYTQPHSLPKKM